jgi:eukaryotic-like serine/threonine-protein kinase
MAAPFATVGRYALRHEIASGGMAVVHLGRLIGPAGFSRTVAIKRLHPHGIPSSSRCSSTRPASPRG